MTEIRILKQIFGAFPSAQAISRDTLDVYDRLLSDIPTDELQTVVDQVIASSKFLPTIGEIREAWRALHTIDAPNWVDAWAAVQAEIRRIGSYGSPKFTDPRTAQVVKAMGWRDLCASENQVADRAHFRDMYLALAGRDERNEKLLPASRLLAERLAEQHKPPALPAPAAGAIEDRGGVVRLADLLSRRNGGGVGEHRPS